MRSLFLSVLITLTTTFLSAQEYNIKNFGAKGDGKANDTKAIQKAIDKCTVTGGKVLFPSGKYLTGTIELKSNVSIELTNSACWSAMADTNFYYPVPVSDRRTFIYANGAENISISGYGTINGGGMAHDVFIPSPGHIKKSMRPYGFLLWKCEKIVIENITMQNSGFWMFRPDHCNDLVIRGIKVYNHANYNNDGFDITDCHRVIISDCILDCEDDAICLKSHSEKGSVDVVISNCIISSHASAIKMGTGSYGAFKRIVVSDCIIKPSLARETFHPEQLLDGLTGLDLSITDGAEVSDINFDNIVIDGVETPIFIRLGNRNNSYNNEKSKKQGFVKNISYSNIRAVNVGPVASSISAYPGEYIENITFSNIEISCLNPGNLADTVKYVPEFSERYPFSRMFQSNLPAYGFYIRHAKKIKMNNISIASIRQDPRFTIWLEDVHGFYISGYDKIPSMFTKNNINSLNCSDIEY